MKLSLPLAMDFGTCNTTAGVYLDDQYFEEAGLNKGEKGLKAGQVNYAASKAGIIGMTKSAARELASRGITVNAIAPGFINTEMTEVLSDGVKEGARAQIPMKEFGETKDVAEAAAFLASDKARYITGQVLCVDGGMAM